MAVKTIRLNDDTAEIYGAMNPRDPAKAMVDQLERFKNLTPTMRPLVFTDPQRARLEKLFAKPIEDPEGFVKWVEHLLTLGLSQVKLNLNAKQIAMVEKQAPFWKKSVPEYLEEKIMEGLGNAIGW